MDWNAGMFKFKVSDRESVSPVRSFLTIIGSLLAGLVAISLIFIFSGVNPLFAIFKIFCTGNPNDFII